MIRKALLVVVNILLVLGLTACGGVTVMDANGDKKSINPKEYLEWDMGKYESVWNMAFDIQHEYEGLPPAFNEDSLQYSALNDSAFGNAFKEDFVNNNEPYYLYKIYIRLKDGWYLGEDFKIKINDKNYSVNDIFGSDYLEMKVRCVDMPTEKSADAWSKIIDKDNMQKYRELIETYFINSYYGIEYVSGIVYSDK